MTPSSTSTSAATEWRIQSGNEEGKFKLSSKPDRKLYKTAPADSLVTQMAARDADTGENSRVSFLRAKFGVRDLFNIKEVRGVITGVNTNICHSILQGKIIENH